MEFWLKVLAKQLVLTEVRILSSTTHSVTVNCIDTTKRKEKEAGNGAFFGIYLSKREDKFLIKK